MCRQPLPDHPSPHPPPPAGSVPPAPHGPRTSIVVLARNQLAYTRRCLDSVARHTRPAHEIIVVDNGSTDGTHAFLDQRRRAVQEAAGRGKTSCADFQVVRLRHNAGYAAGNNAGMARSRHPYILLLNNDVVVTPGWLDRLLAAIDQRPSVGLAGPLTNHASGPQVLRAVGYDPATLAGLDRFAAVWSALQTGRAFPCWRLVGFCMLVKRAVLNAIGGMDARYGLGNFDDDDFCLRAAIAGFRSLIVGDCFVHHFGSRTFAGDRIDHTGLLRRNWDIFKRKWGLPRDLAYGTQWSIDAVLDRSFDPSHHRVPFERSAGSG